MTERSGYVCPVLHSVAASATSGGLRAVASRPGLTNGQNYLLQKGMDHSGHPMVRALQIAQHETVVFLQACGRSCNFSTSFGDCERRGEALVLTGTAYLSLLTSWRSEKWRLALEDLKGRTEGKRRKEGQLENEKKHPFLKVTPLLTCISKGEVQASKVLEKYGDDGLCVSLVAIGDPERGAGKDVDFFLIYGNSFNNPLAAFSPSDSEKYMSLPEKAVDQLAKEVDVVHSLFSKNLPSLSRAVVPEISPEKPKTPGKDYPTTDAGTVRKRGVASGSTSGVNEGRENKRSRR